MIKLNSEELKAIGRKDEKLERINEFYDEVKVSPLRAHEMHAHAAHAAN